MIRDLPIYIRKGFILAKAVRIASIAQPDNIEEFELQEKIKTDDVISSFILKACLFRAGKVNTEFNECSTPHDVVTKIYEMLEAGLIKEEVYSEYSRESPINCTHCQVERGCCKRRKLMLAMVEQILQWLKENKNNIQDIDFADDVTFPETLHTNLRESSDWTESDYSDSESDVSTFDDSHWIFIMPIH